jgi:hypothetical protein
LKGNDGALTEVLISSLLCDPDFTLSRSSSPSPFQSIETLFAKSMKMTGGAVVKFSPMLKRHLRFDSIEVLLYFIDFLNQRTELMKQYFPQMIQDSRFNSLTKHG